MGSDVPVVVYDASVLFPFQTAHILTFMATNRLIRAHWSPDIEREWVERSLEKYGDLERKSVEGRRDAMNRALPDAKVTGYESLMEGISFPDPNDRHVVAAALKCGATLIVSRDKKHFNKRSLDPYRLSRIDPDDLLCSRLDEEPELVLEAADQARQALSRSKPDWLTYLDILDKSGLPRFAEALGRYVSKPSTDETDYDTPKPPGSDRP